MFRLLSAGLLAVALAAPAPAAAKAKKKAAAPDFEKAFKQLDGNSDNKLTPDEFKNLALAVALPKKTPPFDSADLFKKLDTNGNKSLSLDEFKKVMDVLPKANAKTKAKKKKPN